MPSIPRVVFLLGAVLLVGGVLLAGVGLLQESADTCESGYGVFVDRVGANQTVGDSFEQVAYENLTAAQQRVFDASRTAGSPPIYQNRTPLEGIAQTVVTYRGDRYKVSPMIAADCAQSWAAPQLFGGLTAIVGAVLTVLGYGWGRLR